MNEDGELGDGTTTLRASPPTADAITDMQAISAGGGHTCALTTNHGVRCWETICMASSATVRQRDG
jgi:hypothetical protein